MDWTSPTLYCNRRTPYLSKSQFAAKPRCATISSGLVPFNPAKPEAGLSRDREGATLVAEHELDSGEKVPD
jgi:hypothetical protein